MENNVFIPFIVEDLLIRRIDDRKIPSHNQNHIYAKFTFSSSWNGLSKIAIFSKGIITFNLPIVDNICQIPNELLTEVGTIDISIFAGDRRTVIVSTIEVVESGFKEGIPPLPPEPNSIYVQSPNSTIPFVRYENNNFEFFANDMWNIVKGGGGGGESGYNGWTPIFAIVTDGERNVVNIINWTGGGGTKPTTGYLGTTGIVSNISQATNIRGQQGLTGETGQQGPIGPKGESFNPADIERISALETSLTNLESETTAKWVLLNDVDTRTRSNASDISILQDTVGTLNTTLQDRLNGVI